MVFRPSFMLGNLSTHIARSIVGELGTRAFQPILCQNTENHDIHGPFSSYKNDAFMNR